MWFAELPWYDFVELREATDGWWAGLRKHLARVAGDVLEIAAIPDFLLREPGYAARWREPRLLLSQACGYDVLYDARELLLPIATPCYAAEGCEGARYRSFVVVRRERPEQDFAALRGLAVAVNQRTSHSGTNAMRPHAAALHQDGAFFGAVVESGSHLASLRMLASGEVDVACVDAVVIALLRRVRPATIANLRAVACTRPALAPPYVTSAAAPTELVQVLRAALQAAVQDPDLRWAREQLLLRDFAFFPPDAYAELEEFEAPALRAGYRELPAPLGSPLG